jgi:hypothetical protein
MINHSRAPFHILHTTSTPTPLDISADGVVFAAYILALYSQYSKLARQAKCKGFIVAYMLSATDTLQTATRNNMVPSI